jgi:Arc/MetJ family transcription regulator
MYRSHLDNIAGPIPADLAIDDDLINAVLLATDVRHNRRLLRRLLRAYVAGDK